MVADCLPPAISCQLISAAANHAVANLRSGKVPAPFVVGTPVVVKVELKR